MTGDGARFNPADGLGVVLDEHLLWIGQWHRAVFYRYGADVDEESAPAAFAEWVAAARDGDLAHQPAVEKLINLHEAMHRQARMMRLKATAEEFPTEAEYEGVIGRFDEFCLQLRRVERAFGAAASGLDPLTGLRHRRGMSEALEREHNRFTRTGQPYCVAIGDIDKFKTVNDTYGHDVGDRVIATFAAVISRSIRNFDEAFRMGGEEFLICLKETAIEDGYQVIERLRADMQRTRIPLPDGGEFGVTASFGIAQSTAGVDPEALIKRADTALYQAKNGGRNQVVRHGQRVAPAPYHPSPQAPRPSPPRAAAPPSPAQVRAPAQPQAAAARPSPQPRPAAPVRPEDVAPIPRPLRPRPPPRG